jgi:hypothetical protein
VVLLPEVQVEVHGHHLQDADNIDYRYN